MDESGCVHKVTCTGSYVLTDSIAASSLNQCMRALTHLLREACFHYMSLIQVWWIFLCIILSQACLRAAQGGSAATCEGR